MQKNIPTFIQITKEGQIGSKNDESTINLELHPFTKIHLSEMKLQLNHRINTVNYKAA